MLSGKLYLGDNSAAAEIWLLRNKLHPEVNVEEGVSIRAVRRVYAEASGIKAEEVPSPKDIYEIATGIKQGNHEAALRAYRDLGIVLGDALANAITLLDTIIIIGEGLQPDMLSHPGAQWKCPGIVALPLSLVIASGTLQRGVTFFTRFPIPNSNFTFYFLLFTFIVYRLSF